MLTLTFRPGSGLSVTPSATDVGTLVDLLHAVQVNTQCSCTLVGIEDALTDGSILGGLSPDVVEYVYNFLADYRTHASWYDEEWYTGWRTEEIYTVRLDTGATGILRTDTLGGMAPGAFLGEVVTIRQYNEEGSPVEAAGRLIEILPAGQEGSWLH